MKNTICKTTIGMLAALCIIAFGAAAGAEERKATTLADDEQKQKPQNLDRPKAGVLEEPQEAPAPAPKRPKRAPKAPPPTPPPYVDDDADDDDPPCRHHFHSWFHKRHETPKKGAREHDGLFLRFTAGPGFGSWQGSGVATAPSTIGSVSNPSGDGTKAGGSFSLGGVVGDNLILHGDLWFNGNSPRQTRTAVMEFGSGVFGGGVTYYVMPYNIFVSGGVGLATSWLVVLDPNDLDRDWGHEDRHDRVPDGLNYGTGIGAYLMAGKEWWVSDNWALGAAIMGDYAHTQGKELDFNYSGVKVVFTATFN